MKNKSQAYMDRVKKQKIKYRSVRNATGNVSLAKKLSTWSEDRIYNEYGISVNKRLPKLKEVTDRQVIYRDKKIQKWRLATEYGYTLEERKTVVKRSFDYIITNSGSTKDQDFTQDYEINDAANKRKKWATWSGKDRELPDFIKKQAAKINKSMGYDELASYGYAVTYYTYTENMTVDDAKKSLKPDKFSNGNIYQNMIKI